MKSKKTYSAKFKFQVVMEALQSDRPDSEIARYYDVHPVTLSNWRKTFKENGPQVFGGDKELREKQKEVDRMEKLLGQKEVEIAMLKNFLDEN